MESVKDVLGFKPILPQIDDLDPQGILVRYHRDTDELYVHFFGHALPALSVDVNHYLYLRVNPETQQVVGLQFEAFLSHAVRDDPRWLWLGELAGIDRNELESIRRDISPARQWRSVFAGLESATA
jgi:hypothetical protein